MAEFRIVPSRSGRPTLQVNGRHWHSAYDPVREADQWAARQSIDKPGVLLVGEGLGYVTESLHRRNPAILVVSLAIQGDPREPHRWGPSSPQSLERFLSDRVTASSAAFFQILVWPPARDIAPEWVRNVLDLWNRSVTEAQANLATFRGMGRRWLHNALQRARTNPPLGILQPTDEPVLLVAPGPSAEGRLEGLEPRRYHLVALTSAYPALSARGLTPELVVGTDGGYWAERLLPRTAVPLATPLSGALPQTPLPWLAFNQGFHYERFLLGEAGLPVLPARGTVASSALRYLATMFRGPIGVTGLDLGESLGRTHLRPHPLDEWFWDDRLRPAETRRTESSSLRHERVREAGFRQSAAFRLYEGGLREWTHPKVYRIDPSPVPLPNLQEATFDRWLDLCPRTHVRPLRFEYRRLDLASGARRWRQAVETAFRVGRWDDPILEEAARHLCPDALEDVRQRRLEGAVAEDAYGRLSRDFSERWDCLWRKIDR